MPTKAQLEAKMAELKDELRENVEESQRLYEAGRLINTADSVDEILEIVKPFAMENGAVDVSMAKADEEGDDLTMEFIATWRDPALGPPVPAGTRMYVSEWPTAPLWLQAPSNEPFLLPDVLALELPEEAKQAMAAQNLLAQAIMPLPQSRDVRGAGRWTGFLGMSWDKPHEFGEREVRLYKALSALVASGLENLRLVSELETSLDESQKLYEVSRRMNTTRNAEEMLEIIKSFAVKTGSREVCLASAETDETGEGWVEFIAIWRDPKLGPPIPVGTRIPTPQWPTYPIMQKSLSTLGDEVILMPNLPASEELSEEAKQALAAMNHGAEAVIPLPMTRRAEDTTPWTGFVGIAWPEPREFSESEVRLFRALASLTASAVENLRLVENLETIVAQRTGELNRVLDNVNEVVVSTDLEGKILTWNPAAEKVTGWTAKEAIGQNLAMIFREEDRDTFLPELIETVLEKGSHQVEGIIVRKDGSERLVHISNSVVLDDEGRPIGTVGTAADITEQRRAEAERARLQQEIIDAQQKALQELSTPLIPIMDRIIVMPLVGSIDSMRAREITRALLAGISQYRAKIVILDITGVSMVDSGVAAHLNKTIQAARLKGARTIVTGVSDAVAETIVDLGIDWTEIMTLRDLQSGLLEALESMGMTLSQIREIQQGT